jgi:hypothetical protein
MDGPGNQRPQLCLIVISRGGPYGHPNAAAALGTPPPRAASRLAGPLSFWPGHIGHVFAQRRCQIDLMFLFFFQNFAQMLGNRELTQ